MADVSDVSQALLLLAASAVYPNGTGQPSIAATPIRLYEGWPNPQGLDADLVGGTCHVTIFPRQEEKNTTRYQDEFYLLSLNTATISLIQSGQTVTVSGAMPNPFHPHNIGFLVNGSPYVYAVLSGDTLSSIAAALSALYTGSTASGAVITFPNDARVQASRVGITGIAIRKLRQQFRRFQITVWADTPEHRSVITQAIDAKLADLKFIDLPDGLAGRLIYHSSPITDNNQNKNIYRRDLIYSVDYSMTQTDIEAQVINIQITKSSAQANNTDSQVSNI